MAAALAFQGASTVVDGRRRGASVWIRNEDELVVRDRKSIGQALRKPVYNDAKVANQPISLGPFRSDQESDLFECDADGFY